MSLTIQLPFSIEQELRVQAAQNGVSLEKYVAQMIASGVSDAHGGQQSALSEDELLLRINTSTISQKDLQRFRSLDKRRKAEKLTAQEQEELLAGKIIVSMANALVRVGKEFQPLVPPRGSVAAHVQAAVPQCRVVAAFHHLPATELGHIGEPIDSDVLICGDDRGAIQTMSEIISKIPGCRPLDAGELSNAMAIEAFTAVMLQLNIRYKTRVAPKLTGIKGDPRAKKAEPAASAAASTEAVASPA